MCANGVYKSHWEPLAEVHFDFVSNEILDDTYTYCLCSRVLISNISDDQSDDEDFEKNISEKLPPYLDNSLKNIIVDKTAIFDGFETFNQFWMMNGENLTWKSWFDKYSEYIDASYDNKSYVQSQNVKIEYADFTDANDLNSELNNEISNDHSYIPKNPYKVNEVSALTLPVVVTTPPISPISTMADDSSPCRSLDRDGDMLSLGERRERKFSYDSKTRKNYDNMKKNDSFKRKSDSDLSNSGKCKIRDLTVKNWPTTDGRSVDSMTNITRLSMSSFLSTDLEEAKISPKTDQCKTPFQLEETNYDDYWKTIWDEHLFGIYEQYYAMFISWYGQQNLNIYDVMKSNGDNAKSNISNVRNISDELKTNNKNRCKNNKGYEDENKTASNEHKKHSNNRHKNNKKRFILDSVGMLLNTLLINGEAEKPMLNGKSGNNSTGDSGDISMEDGVCDQFPEDGSEHTKGKKETVESVNHNTNDKQVNGTGHAPSGSRSFKNSSDEDEKEPNNPGNIKLKRSHEEEYDDVKNRVKKAFRDIGLRFGKSPNEGPERDKLSHESTLNGDISNRNELHDDNFDSSSEKSADDWGIPAEVVWRRRRIKKVVRQRQRVDDAHQQSTHTYFNNSDGEDEKTNDHSTAADCDEIDMSSECDQPTVRDTTINTTEEPTPIVVAKETNNRSCRSKKNKRKRSHGKLPPEVQGDMNLLKYWKKRWSLFSLFDRGIRLDPESWFSVTPEAVAAHTASRMACNTIVDGFCGAGGNAIQFALHCQMVFACDIDPKKIELAEHNATVYGVRDKIQFIVGDFYQLASSLKADAVFLSPPWGGPQYIKSDRYDVETMLQPTSASRLLATAREISEDIAIFLPRNSDTKQLVILSGEGHSVEIEQNYLGNRLIALTAYYGNLICDTSQAQ